MPRIESMTRFDEEIVFYEVLGNCAVCGEVIQDGEEHFDHEGDLVHYDSSCVMEHFKKFADFRN